MAKLIGYVVGLNGRFAHDLFYSLRLDKRAATKMLKLLGNANSSARTTVTITATYAQPNRLRIYENNPPAYEARASSNYVRGDMIRVQGKPGRTCSLAVSARLGIPAIRSVLREAISLSTDFVLLRIVSRDVPIVEFVPDRTCQPSFCSPIAERGKFVHAFLSELGEKIISRTQDSEMYAGEDRGTHYSPENLIPRLLWQEIESRVRLIRETGDFDADLAGARHDGRRHSVGATRAADKSPAAETSISLLPQSRKSQKIFLDACSRGRKVIFVTAIFGLAVVPTWMLRRPTQARHHSN